ncbi:MAG TPA: class II aldolase/adducin family protein [Anaerolineae bacterium]|nr:class II aldolase/adducin family protein [Anaerolineae bacterium]HQH37818.1 class II aldolase/adducin family protein [Anaerolineae bacterium]
MKFSLLHPRVQLVTIMERIYGYGMTTTSGGNLSILDENGDMWITPAGVDKGTLKPQDIICVRPDGTIVGPHKPSSEYPFHRAIYEKRPDFRAIVHAHPPALIAFSIARQIPNTRIITQAHTVCGQVGYAPYRLPGSAELGAVIAETFTQGFDVVLLENHGVVTGGDSLLAAFQRFETLDFCARTLIQAQVLGEVHSLTDAEIALARAPGKKLATFKPTFHTSRERELRQHIIELVHRAYDQQLMTSTAGTVSARVDENSFLITPYGVDRLYLDLDDVVLIRDGQRERRKQPSRATRMHMAIYQAHPTIGAIITAQSPNATAYSVTGRSFDTRTIPESYIVLRDIPLLPYGVQFDEGKKVVKQLAKDTPVILLQNDAILTTGATLMQAFDRLEVAEFSARAVIDTMHIGELVPIGAEEVKELEAKFLS